MTDHPITSPDEEAKPKSLAEEALLAIDTAVADDRLSPAVAHAVRRAPERLQELEDG